MAPAVSSVPPLGHAPLPPPVVAPTVTASTAPHPLLSSFTSFPGQVMPDTAPIQAPIHTPPMMHAPQMYAQNIQTPQQQKQQSKLPAWLRDEIKKKVKTPETKPVEPTVNTQSRVGYQGFNTIAERMISEPSPTASPEPEDEQSIQDEDEDEQTDEEEAALREQIIVYS